MERRSIQNYYYWYLQLLVFSRIAGNLEETKQALELAKMDDRLYSTAGIHPTRCSEFEEEQADAIIQELITLAKAGKDSRKIVAIGEFGLDYDRLHFCDKEVISSFLAYIIM